MLDLLIGSAQRAPGSPIADRDADEVRVEIGTDRAGPDRLVDLMLRVGPYGDGFGDDPEGPAARPPETSSPPPTP